MYTIQSLWLNANGHSCRGKQWKRKAKTRCWHLIQFTQQSLSKAEQNKRLEKQITPMTWKHKVQMNRDNHAGSWLHESTVPWYHSCCFTCFSKNVLLHSMLLRWWQGMFFFLFQTENFGAAFLLFLVFSNSKLTPVRGSIVMNSRKLQCITLPSLNSWSLSTALSVTCHFPIPSLSFTLHSNFWAVGWYVLCFSVAAHQAVKGTSGTAEVFRHREARQTWLL